ATGSSGAPAGREFHTAVWTGSQMIVWSGAGNGSDLNSGGSYCTRAPSSRTDDSWTPTSLTNVPAARYLHTAVWTGSEMIVWGGANTNYLNTGGRYNPTTNSWTATSLTNAPSVRQQHTAVWTSTEMIVWGGYTGSATLNSGGRRN